MKYKKAMCMVFHTIDVRWEGRVFVFLLENTVLENQLQR
jgi:hypothetical protein